jgi:hypothetical protein
VMHEVYAIPVGRSAYTTTAILIPLITRCPPSDFIDFASRVVLSCFSIS